MPSSFVQCILNGVANHGHATEFERCKEEEEEQARSNRHFDHGRSTSTAGETDARFGGVIDI